MGKSYQSLRLRRRIICILYTPYKTAPKGCLKLRFVDTFRFLLSSLSKLAETLPKEKFAEMKKRFPDVEKFSLLTRKGVFPYQYVTSVEKLHETKLPNPDLFYNKLTLERVSSEDYAQCTC